jgi:hypothetical protein
MSHNTNQYRFYLESRERVNFEYSINLENSNIIFNGIDNNSNLQQTISSSLNTSNNLSIIQNTDNSQNELLNKIAYVKFKIPCITYYSSNEFLPEFFINTLANPIPEQEIFSNISNTYNIDLKLFVNNNLHVSEDITAFATYYNSDINLKKNIITLTNCYDIVSNLNPVTFKWIKNNENSVGFIAQEVEKILPNIVDHNDNEYKILAENKIIAYLIGAIQELDKELRELEKQNL